MGTAPGHVIQPFGSIEILREGLGRPDEEFGCLPDRVLATTRPAGVEFAYGVD